MQYDKCEKKKKMPTGSYFHVYFLDENYDNDVLCLANVFQRAIYSMFVITCRV